LVQQVTVYRFEYFDKSRQCWVVAPDLATERAITEMGAVVLYATAQQIDSRRVGVAGIVRPAPSGTLDGT
jgi:hypothetical protein